jgi:hypothetical protein
MRWSNFFSLIITQECQQAMDKAEKDYMKLRFSLYIF